MQIHSNGLNIEVETHGAPTAVPVLMIMGLGMQLTAWPPALIEALAGNGLAPILFDNRDVGLSSKLDQSGVPNIVVASIRHALHLPVRAPYRLSDMALDAVGVLDALGIERVHVVGVSMGGMIAQLMAANAPTRVASLTLIMTTSGARGLPGPTARARRALLSRPHGREVAALVDHGVGIWRVIASPKYPADEASLRARVERSVRRAYYPQGVARQLAAVIASGDRSSLLRTIHQPTLVIHGREDPLVPAACGADLARKIPGARLELVEGMGHDMPVELAAWLARRIADHCAQK